VNRKSCSGGGLLFESGGAKLPGHFPTDPNNHPPFTEMTIRHLFLSPDHNFVGHFGGPSGTNPIIEVESVSCVAGRGLEGDRYLSRPAGHKGQITFFAWETHEILCRQFGVLPDTKPVSVYRRNVITEGLDLNSLVGREFEIQGIPFFGTEECRPCVWMEEAFGPGAFAALAGRGGLRAKILSDGILRRDLA